MLNEISNKLIYHKNKYTYKEWADATWNTGFNTSLKDVAVLLHVSERWIKENCFDYIHYVVYSYNYVLNKLGNVEKGLTYLSIDEIIDWIIKTGKFEQQMEMIDLYNYLYLANKQKAGIILKKYNEVFERLKEFYNKGTIPESIFLIIRKDFNVHSDIIKNASCTDRNKYPWVSVDSFNIFEKEYYFPSEDKKCAELVYRQAFLRGDIKVTLGKGKTIFIKNNNDIDKMKMPFVIKKNAHISIH